MISNLLLLCIALVSIIVYFSFVLPKYDKILFALYEYRDELALYAMENQGVQDLEEFAYLMSVLNIQIYLVKNNISFTQYYMSTVEKTIENEQKIEVIVKKIKQDEVMARIFEESFEIFSEYLRKKLDIFNKIVLKPLTYFLIIILKLFDNEKKE